LTALASGEKFALYRITMPSREESEHGNTANHSRTLLSNTAEPCMAR
jgi:hypothetical protein